jgi:uncharacterized protein YjbI with pentapeptide repeats
LAFITILCVGASQLNTAGAPDTAAIAAASEAENRDQLCDTLADQAKQQGGGPIPRRSITQDMLRTLIDTHAAVRERHPGARLDLRYSELSGLDLAELSLESADLRFASLERVRLDGTRLADADLRCSRMSFVHGAGDFSGAQLDGAWLIDANLDGAGFLYASLRLANLTQARLKNADLRRADLRQAVLHDADLDGANLGRANIALSDFRPLSAPRGAPPEGIDQVYPRGDDMGGLAALRKSLSDAGRLSDARRTTEVIEVWKNHYALVAAAEFSLPARTLANLQVWARDAAFGWTVRYGAAPGRALLLLVWFVLLFAALYALLLCTSWNDGPRGLFRVVARDSLRPDRPLPSLSQDAEVSRVPPELCYSVRSVVPPAIWFSVMSASRFGYGSVTLGSWLGAALFQEVDYRALGPLRALGGVQSLLSLFLLLMAVITLLGDPFAAWP